jgi:hypothetical protein
MTPTTSTRALSPAAACDAADYACRRHAQFHGIQDAMTGPWTVTTAEDGTPMVAARVTGTEALILVRSFTADNMLILGQRGDVRPLLDVSEDGRTACVWRTGGVWVSLWAEEPATPMVPLPQSSLEPEQVAAVASRWRRLFGPATPGEPVS